MHAHWYRRYIKYDVYLDRTTKYIFVSAFAVLDQIKPNTKPLYWHLSIFYGIIVTPFFIHFLSETGQ